MAVALRNGLKMGGSLLLTWSVAMIVKLRVPAHLGPVRQGQFGFAESFATMFFATMSLGIDTYLIKEVAVRPRHASDIVGGVFALRLVLTFVLLAAMVAVLALTGRPHDVLLAALVFGLINLLMAANATLGAVLAAISLVGPSVIANIVTKVVWGVGLLVGLHYDAPLPVLALPGLVGELIRLAIMLPSTRAQAGLQFRVDTRAVRIALIESAPFYVNTLALSVLGSLGMSVLEFIRVDAREVGWFAAVKNLADLCGLLTPLLFWVVTPILARAFARSGQEGMDVFRRCLEGLVVTIAPITILISAGSDIWVRLAFGERYAPARLGLSILSLVFVMTYMNSMFATTLIIMKRGWEVTAISVSAVFLTALFLLLFVPLGRRWFGMGGECAGAAAAVVASEVCVVAAMISRFKPFPLDGRNIGTLLKSAGLGLVILIVDKQLHGLGPARLLVDAALYVSVALTIGVVRVQDVRQVMRLLRTRNARAPIPVGGGEA
jgi:O-antigen/teichoic acid export membrane protein